MSNALISTAASAAEQKPGLGPWRLALRRFLRNPRSLVVMGVLGVLLTLSFGADWIAPFTYMEPFRDAALKNPDAKHWFGLDNIDRDVLSRVIYGGRVSLTVGVLATLMSVFIGTVVGLLAGFFGGWLDALLMRFTDIISGFPSLLLAVAITAIYHDPHQDVWEKIGVLVIALGIVGWTGIARLVRAQVLSIRTLDYVTAATALGSSRLRVVFRHILPNCISPLIVMTTLAIGGNILGEAGLSFLGLGVAPPYPSWGGMLNDACARIENAWWMSVFPGLAIVITVLAFNLLGDGLRDAIDPKGSQLGK